MAVYTHVPAEALAAFLARFDQGDLVSAKGIAEGIENTNYLVETTRARFILTLYEKRVAIDDLPFFAALTEHLAARGDPVPRMIADRDGATLHEIAGRPACLIAFLPGVSPDTPSPAAAHAAGAAMARMHRSVADFAGTRANALGVAAWRPLFERCRDGLDAIDPALRPELGAALDYVERDWPHDGETIVIHADLFPDNVLMLGDRVTGLIDFYFACRDLRLYDLAVMHGAWSFDAAGTSYRGDVGAALLAGYATLTAGERAVLPLLAQGACIRFALTRAWDWLHTPADALVTRKDPLAYLRRLRAYRDRGTALFA